MISLFIDTSSVDVSIAIVKDSKILASKIASIPNMHSVYTTSFLDQVIKESGVEFKDIDKIMVVNGPGSFTGVRIGVTIAKVMAYLLKLEVVCISSLKMRSISFSHNYCMSLIDAHHDNYYMGLYDNNNQEVFREHFVDKDKVLELINKYNPVLVADRDMLINDIQVRKQNLDIIRIVEFYKDFESLNCHLVVPNYLKLPQALEK